MCAYGDSSKRPPEKKLCAKGKQKRGLPFSDDPSALREGERKKR